MNNPTPQNPDNSQNNQTDGVLSSLVGPGKKYANEEALAKSRVDADAYIQKLESETSELRSVTQTLMQEMDMLKARASILDRINPPGNNGTDPFRAPAQSTPQQSQAPSGISQDDVEKLIEQAEQKKIARKNISEVDAALVKALGSEAQAYVKQKASDLGMEVEELHAIAAKSPGAFLSMLGISNQNQGANGSMYVAGNRSQTGNPNSSPIRNKSFYDKLQKEMGTVKFVMDKNTQIQMHKDMQALGDNFFT